MKEKHVFEIKFNDFGTVYALAEDYTEAESLFREMMLPIEENSRKVHEKFIKEPVAGYTPSPIRETNLKSIIKLEQTKPPLISLSNH